MMLTTNEENQIIEKIQEKLTLLYLFCVNSEISISDGTILTWIKKIKIGKCVWRKLNIVLKKIDVSPEDRSILALLNDDFLDLKLTFQYQNGIWSIDRLETEIIDFLDCGDTN